MNRFSVLGEYTIYSDKDGEFVSYSDYAELKKQRGELIELHHDQLCRLLPPGCQYMDPPDGGSVEPIAQVRRMINALVAENSILLPKAASELSNAWLLNKYWVGISAALMHLEMGRMSVALEWLYGTISGPGLERPKLEEVEDIDAWAEHQNRGSISHSQAMEIIRSEVKSTDAAIAEIGVRAVEGFKEYVLSRGYPFEGDWGLVNGCYNSYINKLRGGGV